MASAADQIFDRLPKEIRRRFEEVPAVIERLEAVAKGLRKREESLSRAVAEAAPEAAPRSGLVAGRREAVGELETARDRASERLEDAVAALENLRLDLLRLHAGVGSPDDLTGRTREGSRDGRRNRRRAGWPIGGANATGRGEWWPVNRSRTPLGALTRRGNHHAWVVFLGTSPCACFLGRHNRCSGASVAIGDSLGSRR